MSPDPRPRVAVDAGLWELSPSTGHGKVWRNVLHHLAPLVHLRRYEPRRRFLRSRADVLLADGHAGRVDARWPVVAQVHEVSWFDPEQRQYFEPAFLTGIAALTEASVATADHVITAAESARDQIIEHTDVAPERVHVVPHGVDLDLFTPERSGGRQLVARALGRADEPSYVLFASTVHPRKNLPALRAAMSELVEAGAPHVLALVLSPAPDRPDSTDLLAAARAELAVPGRVVRFAGVTDEELAALMAGASAFCLPSLSEGFGMTALEALACGTAVIASNRGALPEVVGDAGLVIPPDTGSIRAALERVLGDEALAHDLRRAARDRAASFTWARTATGWAEVLRAAAQR